MLQNVALRYREIMFNANTNYVPRASCMFPHVYTPHV